MLLACAALHVVQLADLDNDRRRVGGQSRAGAACDRLIERRAIALAQLTALLRQLLQLTRARLAAAPRHRRRPFWWPAALHVEQLAGRDVGRWALTAGAVPVWSVAAPGKSQSRF